MAKTYTESMAALRQTGHALNQAITEAEQKGWAVLLDHSPKGLVMRIIQGNGRVTDVVLRDVATRVYAGFAGPDRTEERELARQ